MKEKILEKYNALKLRCANYYKDVFRKMDLENRSTFNWAACICGVYWMIYRRMWFSAAAYVVIVAILMVAASFLCAHTKFDLVPCYKCFLACFLVAIGFFGNSIYRAELKWKIKRGYHQHQDFRATSLMSVALVLLAYDIVEQLCGIVAAFGKGNSASFKGCFFPIFIYAIAFCCEYYTYKSEDAETEPDESSINQYLEKEGDDWQTLGAVIIAIGYLFFVR